MTWRQSLAVAVAAGLIVATVVYALHLDPARRERPQAGVTTPTLSLQSSDDTDAGDDYGVVDGTTTSFPIRRSTSSTSALVATTVADGPQFLSMLEPVVSDGASSGDAKMSGREYIRSVLFARDCVCCSGGEVDSVEYDLGERYRELDAVLGVTDDSRDGYSARISVLDNTGKVFGDWTVKLGDAIPISVDLTGVLRLKIQIEWLFDDLCHLSGGPLITGALGDARVS